MMTKVKKNNIWQIKIDGQNKKNKKNLQKFQEQKLEIKKNRNRYEGKTNRVVVLEI
jgi:hypothetical protein